MFVNFEVDCLMKLEEDDDEIGFPCTVAAVDFTYFESLTYCV